jgi:hypothetical protein
MLTDLADALGQHIDALAYVALIVVLMVVAIHSDRRYTDERDRNERLQRRIQSLVLVVRFQQTLVDAKLPDQPTTVADVDLEPEILDLSVDAMIARMGYCLTCHRLRAPAHFKQTDHLQLEDPNLHGATDTEGH